MGIEFIALDWGTTSCRAYRASAEGAVIETVSAAEGILAVRDGDFEAALERVIGNWDTSLPVLAAGMITSRQGWIELPYVACPAGAEDLAASLHHHRTGRGREVAFSTGLSYRAADGIPDVMRGEEAQVLGAAEEGVGHFVTPGTHSKWIAKENDKIVRFTTYTTGEVFAALSNHTILGRLMKEGPQDDAAFLRGVKSALGDPAGFLHRVFSARSLGLFGEMPPEQIASYLSGQVIGTEIAHAQVTRPPDTSYVVLASPAMGGRYIKAMEVAGLKARLGDPGAIVRGLALIAHKAGLIA